MIVLDEPYVSPLLIEWMESSQHPVLENDMARRIAAEGHALNLIDEAEGTRRLNAGERVCTNSENTLAWVLSHTKNEALVRAASLFKDKAAIRELLRPLDPDTFFRTCTAAELGALDFDELPAPFVIKPSVGFGSLGVYTVANRADWDAALAAIARDTARWAEMYPESVVDAHEFILESYIDGTEYALDAYFDEQGKAHLLNVLRHDFADEHDTSDRLYMCGASIMRDTAEMFLAWLNDVNALVGAVNFPVHPEVRVKDGKVRAIEFNPLRFAGLGSTDIGYYAHGFRTYEVFLENREPKFSPPAGSENDVFVMSLLNAAPDAPREGSFDYDALSRRFSHVLELRKFDVNRLGAYGFLFLRSRENSAELNFLLRSDLKEFLTA